MRDGVAYRSGEFFETGFNNDANYSLPRVSMESARKLAKSIKKSKKNKALEIPTDDLPKYNQGMDFVEPIGALTDITGGIYD